MPRYVGVSQNSACMTIFSAHLIRVRKSPFHHRLTTCPNMHRQPPSLFSAPTSTPNCLLTLPLAWLTGTPNLLWTKVGCWPLSLKVCSYSISERGPPSLELWFDLFFCLAPHSIHHQFLSILPADTSTCYYIHIPSNLKCIAAGTFFVLAESVDGKFLPCNQLTVVSWLTALIRRCSRLKNISWFYGSINVTKCESWSQRNRES